MTRIRITRREANAHYEYTHPLSVAVRMVAHRPEMLSALIAACDNPAAHVWVDVPGAPSVCFHVVGGAR